MSVTALLSRLRLRGNISNLSSMDAGPRLDALLPKVSAYAGFDPTGPSLHVGHMTVLCALARLQHVGIRPVVLIGGATAMIGDPSGRSTDRPLLSAEAVQRNMSGIERCIQRFFHEAARTQHASVSAPTEATAEGRGDGAPAANTSGPCPPPILVNNASWYKEMDALTLLRDVGRHFRLSSMLAKDTVRSRWGGGGGGGQGDTRPRLIPAVCFCNV